MTRLWLYWPSFVIVGVSVFLFGFLHIARRTTAHRKNGEPLPQYLRRSPGQNLLQGLDQVTSEMSIYLLCLFFFPLLLYAIYITLLYRAHNENTLVGTLTTAVFALAFITYLALELRSLCRKRKTLRLEYDGKVAVAGVLDKFMQKGYHIYHDFPANGSVIDHIIVGPAGIFAVATRTWLKPSSHNRLEDTTVSYDGRVLHFPQNSDWHIIHQAENQAAWLSTWIHDHAVLPVAVRAIVVVPGWNVKRTSAEGLPVVNPSQLASLFQYIKPRHLSEEMISQIVLQIEQNLHKAAPALMAPVAEKK